MNQQTIPVHSEQKCYEFYSEPVHSPLVIGNETFVVTMQDQRNIIDRRCWFLSRHPHAHAQPAAVDRDQAYIFLQSLMAQLSRELHAKGYVSQMHLPVQPVDLGQSNTYCFHYEKQTDTDDLPYYQNRNRHMQGEKVVKHVHYYVDAVVKSKATNTNTVQGASMETEEITDCEECMPYAVPTECEIEQTGPKGTPNMNRSRCVACHIEEPGMIALYQHPRSVDRLWTYVTGIIVKSRDQLCIPCYDELRIAHRFKEKCIHNNLNRLGLGITHRSLPHTQPDPPTSDDSITAPLVGETDHVSSEECLQMQPARNEHPASRHNFAIKSEPPPLEEIQQPVIERQPEENVLVPNDSSDQADQTNHDAPPIDVVKMELELSLDDIGLRAESLSDDDEDDGDSAKEDLHDAQRTTEPSTGPAVLQCVPCGLPFLTRAALKQHQQHEHKKIRRDNTNAVRYRRVLSGKINALMCRYCYREFDEADAKAAHETTHLSDPKPFQCSYVIGFTSAKRRSDGCRLASSILGQWECSRSTGRSCVRLTKTAGSMANATTMETSATTATTPGPGAFQSLARNNSYVIPGLYDLNVEDTNWVLTSSFIIFTMQTGFGMLESGCVSVKNEVNIMMKNIIDIVLGGFTYWLFGYAMAFGRGELNNPFVALGDFLIDPGVSDPLFGPIFAAFLFQLSFSTTATTIVSGAMAERCNFKAYCIFSFFNTIVYCIPAGWVWGEHGFLKNLGVVDIAGSGPVHLIGGASAFASAAILGPRLGRYAKGTDPLPLGNPVNACMGLFVLWWGWLAFNSGSTYGVSGAKWAYAARAAVMTMMGSFGGGSFSIIYSMINNDGRMDVVDLINGILASLVSVTAGCYLYHAWEAILIGAIGSALCCFGMPLFDRMGVDDPVGASSVHGIAGIWGVLAVGFFADNPLRMDTTSGRSGLFKGGGWYMLGVQSLSALCLACWGVCSTFILLWLINKVVPIRMDPNEELLGADLMEHRIRHTQIGISRALSALAPIQLDLDDVIDAPPIGRNPGHERCVDEIEAASQKLHQWRQAMDKFSNRETQPDPAPAKMKPAGSSRRRTGKGFLGRTTHGTGKDNPAYDRGGSVTVKVGGDGKETHQLSVIGSEQSYQVGGGDRSNDRNFAWID
uniref:C2H2-type domain-containing protein n=1 Tax=Anopheles dirus TaxID=7168 RepID=A0A182N6G1_9DIPT